MRMLLPPVRERRLVDGLLSEFFREHRPMAFRRAIARIARWYRLPTPRYTWFEYLDWGKSGGELVKFMPPLPKAPDKWREIGIQSGHRVIPCNSMDEFRGLIDLDWYVYQVNKLTLGVM